MIRLIGIKRVIVIGVLLGINLLFAGGYFFVLDPMVQDAQMQLNAVNAQISELRGKISNIQQEMAYLKENIPKYQELQDKGLFLEQDRFMMGRLLEDMRSKSGLSSFAFTIEDLKEIPNADAESMNYRLVSSRIKVERIAAIMDGNIYALLQDIATTFPEHTLIQKFNLNRVMEVNEAALNGIIAGSKISFINADVFFDWVTLVPKAPAPAPDAGPGGAAAPNGFRGR